MLGRCTRQGFILLAVWLTAAGCGAPLEAPETPLEQDSPTDTNLGKAPSELYVASSLLWRPAVVPVCWENPGATNATQRQWVRNAVAGSWEARSGVRFTGWNTCPASSNGIRIRINDEGPHTKGLGTQLNGFPAGMVLNFTFRNWRPSCQNSLQYCVEAIAVHEFGHALGYAHEQNRPDTPSWCDQEQGSNGDWLFGAWDLDSVMNYCNPDWSGNGQLSVTDGFGAQATYGVPWESLGGSLTSGAAVASWAPGRLDIFARGADNALWHTWYENGWHPWESLGGYITDDPAAVSWSAGRLDIFARGGDNALWHLWYDNGWGSWESLGGNITSGPAVASWAPGRLDIFARGGDNALWHLWYDNGWGSWESLGGNITADPAAVSWSAGRLDIFARGGDNALWHLWYDNGWGSWESLGGYITSSPGVASWAPGRLDIFARGGDNALWHLWYENGWRPWEWLGGELTSAPDAVSWGDGRLDIFYKGPDNSLRHSWYDQSW